MAASPDPRHQERGKKKKPKQKQNQKKSPNIRKARNSCLFLAPVQSIRKSLSSLSHLPFRQKLLKGVTLKLLVFALRGGEKEDRPELKSGSMKPASFNHKDLPPANYEEL